MDNTSGAALTASIKNMQPGDTLEVGDGLYSVVADHNAPMIFPPGVTIKASPGTRPLLIGSSTNPPAIAIGDGTTVSGLWFGGVRAVTNVNAPTITMGKGCLVEDCTLFGYANGIQNGSDAHGNVYRRNRFVRCGFGDLSHPLYVANLNSSKLADGCLAELNIMVGCQGYSVHFYHQPSYGVAQNNFMCDCRNGLAIQGDIGGPVSGNHNIIWSVSQWPLYYSVTTGTCDGNAWRNCPQPSGSGPSMDSEKFINTPHFGTNPVDWQENDVVSNFGVGSSDIDAAIAALEASFAGTVQQIHDDATIEPNFALLAGAVQTWAAQP